MDLDEIQLINFHLSTENGSFMLELHEKRYFNDDKFGILITNIKQLNNKGTIEELSFKKYQNCFGFSFVSNIIHVISYITYVEGENRMLKHIGGISSDKFHDKIEELVYEFQSLFGGFDKDFHGNKYIDITDINEN